MSSGKFNFTDLNALDQGATWNPTINWYDTDPDSPFDLTGFTGVLRIKASAKSDDVLLEASTSNARMTLTDTNPNISINVDGAITATLDRSLIKKSDNQLFVYDLFLTSGSGEITKIIRGNVEVIDSVSV